jgi:hypothetical protein
VTRETRELLTALSKLNRQVPGIVLGIADESLPIEKQVEFGALLISAGEALQHHAETERTIVVESPRGL